MPRSLVTVARNVQRGDTVTVLTIFVVARIAVPAQLVFPPLGGAGAPAQLIALAGFAWWIWDLVHRSKPSANRRQPVRMMAGLLAAGVTASYIVAMVRPINAEESSTANLAMLGLLSWLGTLLIANDGIPNLERFETLVRRLVIAVSCLATFALVQFITGQAFTEYIQIPGLGVNNHLVGVIDSRAGFIRPAGTAIHPIELGAVLTMILPLALSCGLTSRSQNLIRRWYPSASIAIAISVSLSRSAIVGAIVGLLLLIPTWPRKARFGILGGVVVLLGSLFMVVPGILGTITGLFTQIGTDTSAASRVDSFPIAIEFFSRSPLFGRGLGTFLPTYRIFDDQYLLLAVEVGAVGLAAFIGLLITGLVAAHRSRRATSDPRIRELAQGLFAAIACGGVSMALFDGLGFPMSSGILFLILGLTGGLWRLVRLNPNTVGNPNVAAPAELL